MGFRRLAGGNTSALSEDERALLDAIAPGRGIDELADATGFGFGEATEMLAHLEVRGFVGLDPSFPDDDGPEVDFFSAYFEEGEDPTIVPEDRPTIFDLATTAALAAQSANPTFGMPVEFQRLRALSAIEERARKTVLARTSRGSGEVLRGGIADFEDAEGFDPGERQGLPRVRRRA